MLGRRRRDVKGWIGKFKRRKQEREEGQNGGRRKGTIERGEWRGRQKENVVEREGRGRWKMREDRRVQKMQEHYCNLRRREWGSRLGDTVYMKSRAITKSRR